MLTRKLFVFGMLSLAGAVAAHGFVGDDAKAERKEGGRITLKTKAPKADVMMESVDGKKYSIDSVAGKAGTLVIFSCNHCPYAVKWEERIAAIGNEYMKKDFGVLVINSNDIAAVPDDGMEHMKTRAKDKKFEFPYVIDADSSVARAFGASKTPEVFLFDKNKELVYWGAVDDNADDAKAVKKHYLKDALDAVAAGKTPATQETKAIGCGIKMRKPAQ